MRAGWLHAFAALAIHHDETGNFGMLEAIDDQAAFAALLWTVEIGCVAVGAKTRIWFAR
jgi:hypothetical protein